MPENFNYIIDRMTGALKKLHLLDIKGRMLQTSGGIIKSTVAGVKIGDLCVVKNPFQTFRIFAEVVGFAHNEVLLIPIGDTNGVCIDAQIYPHGNALMVPVGPQLLGRVLDGLGSPLDMNEKGPLKSSGSYSLHASAPCPLKRKIISKPISLGLRVLDGLLTCGEGQRMGIYGAAGTGKSRLLAALAKNARVDVSVLALIGERGREVMEFIQNDLGQEGLAKSVVVVATSDRSSMERLKAAFTATAIAEFFRDSGKKVLLMVDSITRFARAQREIGLAAGEPPARRGFPPSVFATLPKLLERTGTSEKGSITALYTVLVEGDDMNEPVADETRSILDGHIILSRKLAAANHYPAVDVLKSISRIMNHIISKDHQEKASKVRQILAKYQEMELLIKLGEYKKGNDSAADEAMMKIEAINQFLRQDLDEVSDFNQTVNQLNRLIES